MCQSGSSKATCGRPQEGPHGPGPCSLTQTRAPLTLTKVPVARDHSLLLQTLAGLGWPGLPQRERTKRSTIPQHRTHPDGAYLPSYLEFPEYGAGNSLKLAPDRPWAPTQTKGSKGQSQPFSKPLKDMNSHLSFRSVPREGQVFKVRLPNYILL